jgi:hypothetical protein
VLVQYHLTGVCGIQLSIVLVQYDKEKVFAEYTGYDPGTEN